MALAGLKPPEGTYFRVWNALVTLWYLSWQWLQSSHTLERVVADARRGGADRLCKPGQALSKKLKSHATTSYSDARQRLPVDWVRKCFSQLAAVLANLGQWRSQDLPVEFLDGSTKRLRPYGDIPKKFPPHRTRRQQSYWCLARGVVSFCAATGVATAALLSPTQVSEQALAVELILEVAKKVLYIGDRNFGVWRVVRAAYQTGGHILARLTKVRAQHLLGRKRLPRFLDQPMIWSPSAHDQVDPGLEKEPVRGRLIIIKAQRPGYRPQTLYLFTTLTDVQAYPPKRVLEIYGWRWKVELDYRTVKATMKMEQSDCKSPDMVRKEFYAGLMAYNLVRGFMALAAKESGCQPLELSFSKVQGLVAMIITELFMQWMSAPSRYERIQWLLSEAAAAKLPHRRKPRPPEPRAQYHKPRVFPNIKTTRAEARRKLKKSRAKS